MRGGKEKAMVEMMQAAMAEGKRVVMVTVTASERARIIWTYRLPKDSVKRSADCQAAPYSPLL